MEKNQQLSKNKKSPLILGFLFGIIFGFLLQKGGVTKYDVIVGQLLLTDFTVLKIMLSAVMVGMPGVYLMEHLGWVQLYPKSGSIGMNVIGGLIFGLVTAEMESRNIREYLASHQEIHRADDN